jgi:hypothetical protein
MPARLGGWLQLIPWSLFGGWFLLVTVLLTARIVTTGRLPVDFETCYRAAKAIERGANPYPSVQAAQAIWTKIHQYETDVLAGQALAGQVKEGETRTVGPYAYPPTLALWMARLGINAPVFMVALLISVYGFSWLWLRNSAAGVGWLLLTVGSWDLLSSFAGGNVETLLLFCALLGAWLLWVRQGFWASWLIAFTILVKPFYSLFFGGFGLLMLAAATPANREQALKTLVLAAATATVLIGLEILAWGSELRTQAAAYLPNEMAYHWLVRPVAEQTPMSLWNRSLLQGLVNVGWPAETAPFAALGVGAVMLAISAARIWGQNLPFAAVFALTFVLFYWIRPVVWGFPYLEMVVLVTLWPLLTNHFQRALMLGLAFALALSHWLALIYTIQGHEVLWLTLQKADFTWETWLVLPLCWMLLLFWIVPGAPHIERSSKSRFTRD